MINIAIADTYISLATGREAALRERMAVNYGPFLTDTLPDEILMRVDCDRTIDIGTTPPAKTFRYEIGPDKATLRIYPHERYLLSIENSPSGRCFSIECPAVNGESDTYECYSDLAAQNVAPPQHILDHLLIFALSIAGLHKKILLIHASTITYAGQTIMFLGESGTGKSTHTRMWLETIAGARLLNDDAPALRIFDNGKIKAYGTPWSGKTPCYLNESYPLAALTRIKRAPYNRMTRCATLKSFGAVLPSCLPTLQQCDETLDALCDTLSDLLSTVPVYTLECLPNHDAAHTAKSALFGE